MSDCDGVEPCGVPLEELDSEPVLEIFSKNFLGLKRRFRFFNARFEYENSYVFGKTIRADYSMIENIYLLNNCIKIKLYGKRFAVSIRDAENTEDNFGKLKKLTGF